MMRRAIMAAFMVVAAVAAVGIGGVRSADAQHVANAGGVYNGVAGFPITFNGSSSLGMNLTFTWTFSDGTTATGPVVQKTFVSGGTFAARLTVTDLAGIPAVDTATVLVGTGNLPFVNGGCAFFNGACINTGFLTNGISPFVTTFAPQVVTTSIAPQLLSGPVTTVCNQSAFSGTQCAQFFSNVATTGIATTGIVGSPFLTTPLINFPTVTTGCVSAFLGACGILVR